MAIKISLEMEFSGEEKIGNHRRVFLLQEFLLKLYKYFSMHLLYYYSGLQEFYINFE